MDLTVFEESLKFPSETSPAIPPLSTLFSILISKLPQQLINFWTLNSFSSPKLQSFSIILRKTWSGLSQQNPVNLIPISVLIRVSIATQKEKGSFHLTTLGLQTITEGNQGKNLGAGTEAGAIKNVAYCFVPHGLSSLLSYTILVTCPVMASQVGWSQSFIRKCSSVIPTGQPYFSVKIPLS